MWTPYQTRNTNNKSNGREEMYSHRDYVRAVLESGKKEKVLFLIEFIFVVQGSVHHDSAIERYDEDKRMLAFFDSLLQRELGSANHDNDEEQSDG
jgi:hypothetical protein